MDIEEFTVEVPWGHVAGKIWGDRANPKVLMIHGGLDNAGSFDRLIPLLPRSFSYVCIDLPSHGKSSSFPAVLSLHVIHYLLTYILIMEHFQQRKYIVIGHSYGAVTAFQLAQLYPKYVEKLIMLDVVNFVPVPPRQYTRILRAYLDACAGMKVNDEPRKSYTHEEAVEKLQKGRYFGYISPDAATALLKRRLESVGNDKYVLKRDDSRLKYMQFAFHDVKYMQEIFKQCPVTCPVLLILGKEQDEKVGYIKLKQMISLYDRHNNIEFKYVDGSHDVHNNNPKVVAPHIIEFLLDQKSKL